MEQQIITNDIANELLIINKFTIDYLFKLDNCVDCLALYVFYYKTAKWQKTNIIKASDEYVKKSLKWGNNKITNTKNTLKSKGLIQIINRRTNGKIDGWYIQVNYITSDSLFNEIDVSNHNSQKPHVVKTTSCFEETNALKEYIKCLKKENEMLKKDLERINKQFIPPTLEEIEEYCKERNNGVNAKQFYDYYSVNDWKDNRGNQIKNWKQKMIANWEGKVNKETPKKPYSEIVDGQLIWHYN